MKIDISTKYKFTKYLGAPKVNELKAVKPTHREHTMQYAEFECSCGNKKITRAYRVKYGETKSCGCLRNVRPIKHGMWLSREYSMYWQMRGRCENIKNPQYKKYGGKGITVCSAWVLSAAQFFRDMGKAPSKYHVLMRHDLTANYSKDNCYWGLSHRSKAIMTKDGLNWKALGIFNK